MKKYFKSCLVGAALSASMLTAAPTAQAQEPFIGNIGAFGFNFCPRGWATLDGQILPINQNQALFSLLGTTYGGDGRTSFALPDLRGRVPIHNGRGAGLSNYNLGQRGGISQPDGRHPRGSTTGRYARTALQRLCEL